jgi:hypothetical protein
VRNRFPPPTSLKHLEDVRFEVSTAVLIRATQRHLPEDDNHHLEDVLQDWYKILLEVVHNLYKSIPRKTVVVSKTKGGPKPYNKEMCTVSVMFPYFVQPLYIQMFHTV